MDNETLLRYRTVKIKYICFLVALCLSGLHCGRSDLDKGMDCLTVGDHEMAEEFFRKELLRNPLNAGARLGMGKALLQRVSTQHPEDSGLWVRALTNLEAARTLNAASRTRELLSQVWLQRASYLLEQADTVEALSALTRAIEHDSRNGDALNLAGIVYFRIGEEVKARAIFNRALLSDSLNSSVLFNLGMVDWHEGNIAAAHGLWLRSLELSQDDSEILYWFARAEKELRSFQHSFTDASGKR